MYNDIIMIFLCVFAVYGVYAVAREISALFFQRYRIAAAVRIDSLMSEDEQKEAISVAESYIYMHSFLERTPIIICDSVTEDLEKYGYKIYIKHAEEK